MSKILYNLFHAKSKQNGDILIFHPPKYNQSNIVHTPSSDNDNIDRIKGTSLRIEEKRLNRLEETTTHLKSMDNRNPLRPPNFDNVGHYQKQVPKKLLNQRNFESNTSDENSVPLTGYPRESPEIKVNSKETIKLKFPARSKQTAELDGIISLLKMKRCDSLPVDDIDRSMLNQNHLLQQPKNMIKKFDKTDSFKQGSDSKVKCNLNTNKVHQNKCYEEEKLKIERNQAGFGINKPHQLRPKAETLVPQSKPSCESIKFKKTIDFESRSNNLNKMIVSERNNKNRKPVAVPYSICESTSLENLYSTENSTGVLKYSSDLSCSSEMSRKSNYDEENVFESSFYDNVIRKKVDKSRITNNDYLETGKQKPKPSNDKKACAQEEKLKSRPNEGKTLLKTLERHEITPKPESNLYSKFNTSRKRNSNSKIV